VPHSGRSKIGRYGLSVTEHDCLFMSRTAARVRCILHAKHGILSAHQAIENKRTRELSEEELTTLREEVEKYTVEGDLRRFNSLNIKRLKEIGCYRGRRHVSVRHARPVTCCSRGQRAIVYVDGLLITLIPAAGLARQGSEDEDQRADTEGQAEGHCWKKDCKEVGVIHQATCKTL